MTQDFIAHLGPLAPLAGVWEGQKGEDTAPSDDRGTEYNKFRERITFDAMGQVRNHEQTLYGLRYVTMVWRLGETNPFHEEGGGTGSGMPMRNRSSAVSSCRAGWQ